MEIENEKLHKEILLLRNSIDRGIAKKELEGNQHLDKFAIEEFEIVWALF